MPVGKGSGQEKVLVPLHTQHVGAVTCELALRTGDP